MKDVSKVEERWWKYLNEILYTWKVNEDEKGRQVWVAEKRGRKEVEWQYDAYFNEGNIECINGKKIRKIHWFEFKHK